MLGNLEAAIAMAQRLEVYRGGDGPRRPPKDPKSSKIRKGERGAGRGELVWGDRLGGPSREKIAAKEGQGRLGLRQKEGQAGRTKESTMPQLSW